MVRKIPWQLRRDSLGWLTDRRILPIGPPVVREGVARVLASTGLGVNQTTLKAAHSNMKFAGPSAAEYSLGIVPYGNEVKAHLERILGERYDVYVGIVSKHHEGTSKLADSRLRFSITEKEKAR